MIKSENEDFLSFMMIKSSFFFKSAYSTIILVILNCILFIITEFYGGSGDIFNLIKMGAKVGALIWDGEYFRLVASLFLHMGIAHLLFNMFFLILFGPFIEKGWGSSKLLFIYISSGLIGNLLSLKYSHSISTGSSGAVLGVIGALLVFLIINKKSIEKNFFLLTMSFLFIFVIFTAYSTFFLKGIDNMAHIGGFLWGILTGIYFSVSQFADSNPGKHFKFLTFLLLFIISVYLLATGLEPQQWIIRKNYQYLGNENYLKENFNMAISFYEKSLSFDDNDKDTLRALGVAYIQAGQLKKGIFLWEKLLKCNPDDSNVRKNLARIYIILADNENNEGFKDLAEALYEKAIKLDFRNSLPYIALGDIYFGKGDYKKGFDKYKHALALDKQNRELFMKLKEKYSELLMIEAYPVKFQFATEREYSKKAYVINKEGERILLTSGNYEKALDLFHNAIEIDESYAIPYLNIARILLVIERYEESEDYIRKSLSLERKNWECYFYIGKLEIINRNYSEAKKQFNNSVLIKPDYAPGYAGLAECYFMNDELDKAEQYTKKALKLDPNNPHFHLLLADIAKAARKNKIYFNEVTMALAISKSISNTNLENYILKKLKYSN